MAYRFGNFTDTGIVKVKDEASWTDWRNKLTENKVVANLGFMFNHARTVVFDGSEHIP